MQEGYISVTGGKVWYKIVGAHKKAPPLFVLHGGPGVPHDYLEPLEALGDERPVIFYDQLGCGNSDRPDEVTLWTVARYAAELGQVRKALNLAQLHILGQSWGCMLAVDYLLSRPQGVMSLILSGPCLSSSRFAADQRAYLAEFPEDMQKIIREKEAAGEFHNPEYREAMRAYYERHVCRLTPWPECLTRALEKMGQAVYEYMWGPSEFTLTGTLKTYDRADRLKDLRVPTLFTCGRYDEATPATTSFFRSRLPGAEMVVFDDASHEHHLEQTESYLKVVRDFLKRAEEK
jgi:proline-specific peptidase